MAPVISFLGRTELRCWHWRQQSRTGRLQHFNADGRVDFAVADSGGNSVTVLLNTTSSSQKHVTSVAVTSSLNPSMVGQSVTFTATVSSNSVLAERDEVANMAWPAVFRLASSARSPSF